MTQELFTTPYTIGWDRKIFSSPVLGIDTETTLIESKGKSPRMVLASVSDGETAVILRPDEIDAFLSAHSSHTFVCHNAAFDFWVLEEHSPRVWNLVESNRLHDTMLLDQLIRLANGLGESNAGFSEGKLIPRNLGKLSTEYAKEIKLSFEVDKESEYRLRFGELLLKSDWSQVDPGFFQYAAGDPLATKRIYDVLYPQALAISQSHGVDPSRVETYGPLTHHLQVRASISLLKLTRNGIGFDLQKATALETSIRSSLSGDISSLDSDHPLLFQKHTAKKGGGFKFSEKSVLPSMSTKYLREQLRAVCVANNVPVPLAQGKTANMVSLSADDWEQHRNLDPLVSRYLNLASASKILSFFKIFEEASMLRIHPSYHTLVRTGRTSSSAPNIQQMPGDKRFRSLFVPRAGKKFAVIDYAFIELRTLAVICEQRFGFSVLADTVRKSIDPHVYTAAMIQNLSLEEFTLLKSSDPARFKACRQSAKALNFGIPGGLGAKALADYALASYGVNMSVDEAKTFRNQLIYKIYPEIGKYLGDNILEDLSKNLGIPEELVSGPLQKISAVPSSAAILLANTVKLPNRSAYRYSDRLWNTCWSVLGELMDLSHRDFSHLRANVSHRSGGLDMHHAFFSTTALTLTGRVRGHCAYTQARNTPFQSLAADGAKRALWRLVREKFFPVAFVHDEVVLEVASQEEADKARRIMEEEMFAAVDKRLPIECSLTLCDVWEK